MFKKIRFLLWSLFFAITASSIQAQPLAGPSPRIIGGVDATPGDYPWAVALLRANITGGFNAQFCGGSLIADRWVLTAAHCVDGFSSASEIQVAIGIDDLDAIHSSDRKSINTIFVHPDYDAALQENDIALLELTTPSSAPVLAVADNNLMNTTIAVGDPMTIIGWGTTNASTPSYPNLLQEADVPLFDFTSCNDTDIYNGDLTSNMFCAGFAGGGTDTCQGDSGGPILYFNAGDSTWYQTGITSFGNGCAVANNPGVYTRAANYLSWINDTTAIAFPNQYQFGFHGIGRVTSATLTLRNYSGTGITVNSVQLTNSTIFSLSSETCTGVVIANGGNCTITLQFLAVGAGTQLATLTVDLGTGGTLGTAISGVGLDAIGSIALDESPSRTWYSGGDARWSSTSIANSNNDNALRSGSIGNNQSSALLAYFTGPSTLSFRWKASTEQSYDFQKLYIDGVLIDAISGEQDWTQRNIALTPGTHRVAWVYEKDITDIGGLDTVWLDSVNTPYSGSTIPGDPVVTSGFGGGGGAFSETWILLFTVMFILRTMLSYHAQCRARR